MQYRLMVLVAMLMVVVLLMFEAAKPSNWEWMWKFARQENIIHQTTNDEKPVRNSPIDNRLITQARSAAHPEDSFHAEITDDFASGSVTETYNNVTIDDLTREMLGTIQDDTFFRAEETNAWFLLLDILRRTSSHDILDRSKGKIPFAQLFRQTDDFRGQLITVNGTIRRVHQVPAAQNEIGIETYWQCWIRPTDGSNSPIVAYMLELPDGLEEGMDLRQSADITGFCFKRWAYNSATGPRIAPIVLAKSAVLRQSAASFERPAMSASTRRIVTILAAIAGVTIAGLAVLASNWKRKRFEQHEREEVAHLSAELGDQVLPTVCDRLRDLEESARPSNPTEE